MKVPWPLSAREALVHYFVFEYLQDDLVIVLTNSVITGPIYFVFIVVAGLVFLLIPLQFCCTSIYNGPTNK